MLLFVSVYRHNCCSRLQFIPFSFPGTDVQLFSLFPLFKLGFLSGIFYQDIPSSRILYKTRIRCLSCNDSCLRTCAIIYNYFLCHDRFPEHRYTFADYEWLCWNIAWGRRIFLLHPLQDRKMNFRGNEVRIKMSHDSSSNQGSSTMHKVSKIIPIRIPFEFVI